MNLLSVPIGKGTVPFIDIECPTIKNSKINLE